MEDRFAEYMDNKANSKIKKYELIANGCHYDEVETTSFDKARKYFSNKWTGKYTILCLNTDERKNVEL
jgi:hypothetical protein